MAGRKRRDLDSEALTDAYLAGEGPEAIGRRYGVSGQTVRNRLTEAGVPLRPHGEPKDLPMDQVADEYQQGASLLALGRRYGAHWTTIRRRLERHGVKLREREPMTE